MRFSLLLALLIVLAGPSARGDGRPTASLRYTLGPGAERCPDAETIRDAVAARLGREPWDEAAPRVIIVAVGREGEGLRARVELRRRDGKISGLREMSSPARDCVELAAAVELAISIAIDPLSFTSPRAASEQPAASQPAAEPAAADPEVVATSPAPARKTDATPLRVSASVGGLAALGSAPAVAGGIALQGQLRWGTLSAALEGRIDLPAYRDIPGGRVSSSLLLAGALGCVHLRSFFGCGALFAGALRGAGHDIAQPDRATLPYAAAGARLGVEIPLYSVLSLRVHGDVLATLTRITLRETGGPTEYWSTPPLSGALGAAAVGRFR